MILVPWVTQGQTLDTYSFSTGVDASKWITLSSPSNVFESYSDDVASSVLNIGFTFPFGDGVYSQFSVSSNGTFRLGPTATLGTTQGGMFNASYYNANLPKISGIARDMSTGSDGYVHYKLTGTAPNRVFVCEFALSYTYGNSYPGDVKWQVQLHEDSSKVVIVYAPTVPATTPSSFHIGMAETPDNIIVINSSTHNLIYSNGAHSTTYSTWPGASRYYEFVRPVITCPKPTSIAVANLEPSSFDVSWTDTSDATSWIVRLLEGDSLVYDNVENTDSVSFTGLAPATRYSVQVAGLCLNGDTSFFRTTNVLTPCVSLTTLPFTENFDSVTGATTTSVAVNNLPPCWANHNTGTNTSYSGYPIVYSSSSYAHSGSNLLRFYTYITAGTYSDQIAILPLTDSTVLPLSSLQLSFWMRSTSTSYLSYVIVGVMTDPTDPNTFVPVETVYTNGSTTYEQHSVMLAAYQGPHGYIAIKAPQPTTSYNALCIDDLVIDEAPSCLPVYDLTVDRVTTDSIYLSWTPLGNESAWIVSYGTNEEVVYDTALAIGDLSANTDYTFSVSAFCDGMDTSIAVYVSARTSCGLINELPYSYGFEDLATGNSSVRPDIPCWHHLNNGTSYFGYPYVSSTTPHSGTRNLYWYASTTTGTYGDYEIVVLPAIDTTVYPINTLQLTFWARPSSTSYSPIFHVGVMTDPDDVSTFQQVETINVQNVTTWQEFTTVFSNFSGYGNYLAVRLNRPTSSWYAYTDDFTIEEIPNCPSITSIHKQVTASAAYLSWTYDEAIGTPTGFDVSYRYADDSTATPTSLSTTDEYMVLTGLDADTAYWVSITAQCDDGTGEPLVTTFRTQFLPCVAWDTTGGNTGGPADTVVLGTPGTSTGDVMPLNQSYDYSYCQHLFNANEIPVTGPTTFNGIGFDYAYTQPMTHATNCSIYLANTTRANMMSTDSTFIPYNQLQLVYVGPLNCTASGWNYFDFNRGSFQYDGVSNLCVAIVDNSGSSDGSNYKFRYQTISTSAGPAMTHRVFGSTPYDSTAMNAARAGQSYWRSNTRLLSGGTGECIAWSTCVPPAVNVGPDGNGNLELTWIPGYQETTWDVDYRRADTNDWTNVATATTTTSQTFLMTDLQPNTEYLFRVTANCSDTNMSATASYTTPCDYINIPYSYGFEDLPTGSSSTRPVIQCWHHLNNGSSYPGYPYVTSTTPHSGSRNLYWYLTTTTGTYGDYEVVVLPPVDIVAHPINTLQLTFWARPSSTTYAPVFYVGVMTDPTDINTFHYVDTIMIDHLTTNWMPYEAVLRNYTGNGQYVALRANRTSSAWYAYTDDITLENAPNCPRVSDVVARNITMNDATIGWASTGADEYEVEYGPTGFTQGTGTIISYIYDDSVSITGLSANSPYNVYVRGICAGDTSNWSFVYTFRTSCGEIDQLPFFEDFESHATTTNTTGTPFIPCWALLNNGTSYGNYPNLSASTTYNHTPGGGKGLYWYASTTTGTYSDYMYLILPPVDTTTLSLSSLQLVFWAKSSSTSYSPVFQVGVMQSATDTAFQPIQTISIPGITEWTEYTVGFGGFTGYGQYIAIRALRPTSVWYAYVDDIKLELLPACSRVEDLHVAYTGLDSITIAWTDTSSTNTAWYVEYDTVNFTPGSSSVTPIHVYDTVYTMAGLDSGMTYYIYVYPDCGGIIAERHITATTLAASPSAVPYFCDFENPGVNGWDLYTSGQTNYWMVGNATGNTGRSMYVTNDGSSNSYNNSSISYSYAVRTFHLSDSGEYAYSFDWKCNGEGNYDFIRVLLVPAATTFDAGQPLFGTSSYNFGQTIAPAPWIDLTGKTTTPYGLNLQTTWQTRVGVVHVSTPGNYKLVFSWTNDGSGGSTPPGAIDNISLTRNSCPMPQNISAVVSADSINLTWTPGGTESAWEVTLGSSAVVVTSPAHTFAGLSPNTSYTVTVRSICGVGDTSLPYTETYRTPCVAASLPYSENFDSLTTSTTAATGVYVPCWDQIMTGTATYQTGSYLPQVYYNTTYAHSGNYSYRLYGIGYHMLPPVTAPLDSLQLTFWDYTTSTSYGLEVGVMEGSTFIPIQTINSPTSTHVHYTVYFGSYTGNSRIIAFRNYYTTSTSTYYSYHYIDDVTVEYLPSCPPVVALTDSASTPNSITLDWIDQISAASWQVECTGNGTTISTIVTSHPATIVGLTPATAYQVRVRPICSATDSGHWCEPINAYTACDLIVPPYVQDFNAITGTAYNSEGLLPPCWVGYTNGTTAAYMPHVTNGSTYSYSISGNALTLTSGSTTTYGNTKYVRLPQFATPVRTLTLSYWFCTESSSSGTLSVGYMTGDDFTTDFVPVVSHPASSASLHSGNGAQPAGTGIYDTVTFENVPDSALYIAFMWYYNSTYYSCCIDNVEVTSSAAVCAAPVIASVTKDYHSATVAWTGQGTDYEVNIKETTASSWPTPDIAVSATSHTFNGLLPSTSYTFRVRQDCNADSIGYSEWVEGVFITDSLPCFAPDSLHTTAVTNATATFDWTGRGNEANWDIHVWTPGGIDSIYRVSTRPATVGGFIAGITYNASIRALCGVDLLEGEWSDTVTFITAICPDVTGLTASNVTTNSVTLNWTADPMAQTWTIEYGFEGFNQGTGTTVVANTNSYVVTGLLDDTPYEFYVKANCGTDWISENWVRVLATTQSGGVTCDAPTGVNATVADNAVTVNWTANTGNISFEIEYGPRGFSHGAGTTTTATTAPAVISNLDYETQYDLYVRAICDQNTYSAYSNVVTFTTGQRPSEDCEPVSNLTVTEITDNTAHVAWTPAEGTDTWQIVVTDAQGANVADEVRTDSFFNLAGLTAGKDYTVKVRTVCGDDNFSAYVSTNFRTTGGVGISDVNTVSCTIYPNPTSNATTISVSGVNGKVKIEVVDMNGRVVSSESLECSSDCVKTMDVDNLAQGAYFVRITADNTNMVRKLIVR